jgi:hypothetical protein
MKLAVSHDAHGNVTTLFDPAKLHGDKGFLTYVPAKGEKHHVLDLPKELEGKPFEELPKLLRVNAAGAHPRLEAKT